MVNKIQMYKNVYNEDKPGLVYIKKQYFQNYKSFEFEAFNSQKTALMNIPSPQNRLVN